MELNYELNEVTAAASTVLKRYGKQAVWAFHGQLGAGKTTFIHALCDLLQVEDTVSSPTFSLINEYRSSTGNTIYHMDWYRLKDEEEAMQAGIEDSLYSGHLCLIEWPEKAAGLLPDDTVHIYLETTGLNTRRLTING